MSFFLRSSYSRGGLWGPQVGHMCGGRQLALFHSCCCTVSYPSPSGLGCGWRVGLVPLGAAVHGRHVTAAPVVPRGRGCCFCLGEGQGSLAMHRPGSQDVWKGRKGEVSSQAGDSQRWSWVLVVASVVKIRSAGGCRGHGGWCWPQGQFCL